MAGLAEWQNKNGKYTATQTAERTQNTVSSDNGQKRGLREWREEQLNATVGTDINSWITSANNLMRQYGGLASSWKANDDPAYQTFNDERSRLLSYAQNYRQMYQGNNDAINTINSVVRSLSDARTNDIQNYWSQWDSAEQYNTAKHNYDLYQKYNPYTQEQIDAELAGMDQKNPDRAWLEDYSKQKKYLDLDKNADFAENSKYTGSTKQSNPIIVPQVGPDGQFMPGGGGNVTYTGYGDILYDYINGDPDARATQHLVDINSEAARRGTDASYLRQMTDEQVARFNYIYKKQGADAAYDYVESIKSELNYKNYQQLQQMIDKTADEDPFGAWLTARIINLQDVPLVLVEQIMDYIEDGKLEEYAGYNRAVYLTNGINAAVGQKVKNKYGDVGEFFYSNVTSMVDNVLRSFASGVYGGGGAGTIPLKIAEHLSLITMASGAAASGIVESKMRGLTDDQAMGLGVIAGLAEYVTEKIGFEKLFDPKARAASDGGKSELMNVIRKYILPNMKAEAAEEFASGLTNLLADFVITGDQAEKRQLYEQYKANGESDGEALWHTLRDTGIELGLEALGGALSGGVMSGVSAYFGYHSNVEQTPEIDRLISTSLELNPENQMAKDIKAKFDAKQKVTPVEITRLQEQYETDFTNAANNDQTLIANAAADQLRTRGETGDVDAISKAIAKYIAYNTGASDQKLTRAETRSIVRSQYGQRVLQELSPVNVRGVLNGDTSSLEASAAGREWAQNIGTKVIRPNMYNPARNAVQPTQIETPVLRQSGNEIADTLVQKANQGAVTAEDIAPVLDNAEAVQALESTVGALELEGKTREEQVKTVQNAVNNYVGQYQEDVRNTAQATQANRPVSDSVENVAQKYGKQAGAVRSIYNMGNSQDVETFARDLENIIRIGRDGGTEETALGMNNSLNDLQKLSAWMTGRAMRDSENIGTKKRANNPGTVRANGLTNEIRKNPSLRKAVQVLRAISAVTGLTIDLYDSSSANFQMEQGSYSKDTNVIRLDIRAGINSDAEMKEFTKYAILRTFGHEVTHFGQDFNPAEYNILATTVLEALSRNEDFDLESRIRAIQDNDTQYNVQKQIRQGKTRAEAEEYAESHRMTRSEAIDEIVADGMADVLPETDFFDRLIQKDMNVGQKLLNSLKQFISRIKERINEYFSGLTFNKSPEANALKYEMNDQVKYLEGLAKQWENMLLGAVENYQNAEVSPAQAKAEDITREGFRSVEDTKGEQVFNLRTMKQDVDYYMQDLRDAGLRFAVENSAEELNRDTQEENVQHQDIEEQIANDQSKYEGKELYKDADVYDYDFLVNLHPIMEVQEGKINDVVGQDGNINDKKLADVGMENAINEAGGVVNNGAVVVANEYTGRNLVITRGGIVHSVHTDSNDTNRANARIAQKIGLLAKYAVPINGLVDEADVVGTYAMVAPVLGEDGKMEKVAVITIEVRTGNLVDFDVYEQVHAASGRKKNEVRKTRVARPVGPTYNTHSFRMSISDFLDEVNSTHRGILSKDVLDHYNEERPMDGYWGPRALFSHRDYDSMTYAEITKEQQQLTVRENEIAERKRAANNTTEYIDAVTEYMNLVDEAKELLAKRQRGEITPEENERINALRDLRKAASQRIEDVSEKLGLTRLVEEEREIQNEREALRQAADSAWEREGAEKENAAIEKSGLSAAEYFRRKALRAFKTTTNFNEAGYLLPDGRMLNFSGGERNHRYRDHREIGEIYEATSGTAALNRFLNDGNIRVMAESPGIDLAAGIEPTREQYAAIRKFINTIGTQEKQFYIDFSNADGSRADNLSYDGNVNASDILNDIKRFYQSGGAQQRSDLMQFHVQNSLRARDAEYLELAKNPGKNREQLQKMILERAKEAMPNTKAVDRKGNPLVLYHGTTSAEQFYTFRDGNIYMFNNPSYADQYTHKRRTLSVDPMQTGRIMPLFANITNPLIVDANRHLWRNIEVEWSQIPVTTDDIVAYAKENGYDGAIIKRVRDNMFDNDRGYADEYIAFSPNQVKSAGPTYEVQRRDFFPWENRDVMTNAVGPTYDDNGNVIPLSERFNNEEKDIRYSLRTQSYTDRELLQMAADNVSLQNNLTQSEKSALSIFNQRLEKLRQLEEQQAEQRRILEGLTDPNEITKTQNRINILGRKIGAAENLVLNTQNTQALKKVLRDAKRFAVSQGQRNERARLQERSDITKYRDSIQKKVKGLSDKLLKNSDKEHIPEALKGVLGDFLQSIDFSSRRLMNGGEPTKRDIKYADLLDRVRQALQKQTDYMNNPENGNELGGYLDLPPEFVDTIQEHINKVKEATNGYEGNGLFAMDAAELKNLDHILGVISHSVNQINEFHMKGRFANIPLAGQSTITDMNQRRKFEQTERAAGVRNMLAWKNMLPFYAFKKYGAAGQAIFNEIQRGWEKFAFNTRQVIDFAEKTYNEKEQKEWSNKVHTIDISDGRQIKITTAQIMSLYCLNKRQQARQHILGGGIRVGNIETKNGLKKQAITQTDNYTLTTDDVKAITSQLTDRQIEVANKLQEYMNTVGTRWGNEVSMARFGYEGFGEPNYFPIESDDTNLPARDPDAKANDLFRLINMSMTKALNPKANNALVVSDIFKVFANHMSDMAKYNSLVLPSLDAMKWINYKETQTNPNGQVETQTVKRAIERAYGKEGMSYFMNFMKDLNGNNNGGRDESGFFGKLMSAYKVAAVAANLRVGLLQPTSYAAASQVLSPAVMTKALTMDRKKAHEERMKYSGISIWKDLGFFDTNIGRNVEDLIMHNDTVRDKITERALWLAEKGDSVTWDVIWNACKLDQQNKGLKGDELIEATNNEFMDVIYQTQVVDSTLTRSQLMRDKSMFIKNITGFFSEPTIRLNQLVGAYNEFETDAQKMGKAAAWSKNKGKIITVMGAYVGSQLLAAIVESIADAARDDDDYESYLDKWLQAFLGDESFLDGNLYSDLSIAQKLPVIKDIISNLKGYESTNMTFQAFNDLINIKDVLTSKSRPAYGKIYKVAQMVSRFSGVPVSNAMREFSMIWNNTVGVITGNKLKTYERDPKKVIKEAYATGKLDKEQAIHELMKKEEMSEEDALKQVTKWQYAEWDTNGGGLSQEEVAIGLESGKYTQKEKEKIWSDLGYKTDYGTKQQAKAKAQIKLDENAVTYDSSNWQDGMKDGSLPAGDKDALMQAYGSEYMKGAYKTLRAAGYSATATYEMLQTMDKDQNKSIKQEEAYNYLVNKSDAEALRIWNSFGWKTDWATYKARQH